MNALYKAHLLQCILYIIKKVFHIFERSQVVYKSVSHFTRSPTNNCFFYAFNNELFSISTISNLTTMSYYGYTKDKIVLEQYQFKCYSQ